MFRNWMFSQIVMGSVLCAPVAATAGATGSGLLGASATEPTNSPAASSATPAGFWVTEDQAWTVQIMPCPSGYCGSVVGLGESSRPDVERTDLQNPDPARRTATLCGLPVLGGFRPVLDSPGKWENGWIYNPENGKTYQSEMKLEGTNTLRVRGFVIISLLGRSETLTRVSSPLSRCTNVPGVATGIPAATSAS